MGMNQPGVLCPSGQLESWEEKTIVAEVVSFSRGWPERTPGYGREDLEQECRIAWWLQRGRTDTRRSSPRNFLKIVCKHCLCDILRRVGRVKRQWDREIPFSSLSFDIQRSLTLGDGFPSEDAEEEGEDREV